jgi:NitT/TauT family transport system ATP-binding protein
MSEPQAAAAIERRAGATSPPPLEAADVAKTYDDGVVAVPVIGNLTFSLAAGEIVAIVGPSGCGKSTLLNILSGLIEPTAGRVLWYGERVTGMPDRVGYMLQKDLLFPWRTALDNVTLGLEVKGIARGEAMDRAHVLIDQLGLHGFARAYPGTLSGGMRQRVALARTLATDPMVMLMDEPFAALDFQTKLLIESDTARLVREQHRSMLLITHDIEEAVSMADRVIVLTHRPTRVRAVYDIVLEGERTDMIAARDSAGFGDYVRRIWADLEVGTT